MAPEAAVKTHGSQGGAHGEGGIEIEPEANDRHHQGAAAGAQQAADYAGQNPGDKIDDIEHDYYLPSGPQLSMINSIICILAYNVNRLTGYSFI